MIHTIYRDDEIIVALNGVPYTIDIDDPRYDDVDEAIIDEDENELERLLSLRGRSQKMLSDISEYGIEESGGEYTFLGTKIAMDLTDYLRSALDNGDYMPVVNFIQRLHDNPNHDTRMRLFTFMERNKMPIDSEGRFLAYKAVTSNYKDKYGGTIDNSIGTTVPRMSWGQVDTNPTHYCSKGYHACSRDYLDDGFYRNGDRVISVAIAPEDVGSIPDDYNSAKLRCRQYEVVADITDEFVRNRNSKLRSASGVNPVLADTEYQTRTIYDYY